MKSLFVVTLLLFTGNIFAQEKRDSSVVIIINQPPDQPNNTISYPPPMENMYENLPKTMRKARPALTNEERIKQLERKVAQLELELGLQTKLLQVTLMLIELQSSLQNERPKIAQPRSFDSNPNRPHLNH